MRHLITLTFILMCLASSQFSNASQEGILTLSEFSVSSQGIGSSGPVKIEGKQTAEGIVSLKVFAFDHEFVAPPNVIKELRGFSSNGLLVSYEQGYKELGGRIVYLSLSYGFSSGITATKQVAINEKGIFKFLPGAVR